MAFNFDFFTSESEEQEANTLIQYLQEQHPETLAWVAQSASPEIKEIITQNIQGLVGMLPSEEFHIQISTDRENLGNLLASAMMTGYFLGQMENRKNLESTFNQSESLKPKPSKPKEH